MFTVTLTMPDFDTTDPDEAARMFLAAAEDARPLTLELVDNHTGARHRVTVADWPAKVLAGSPDYLARFPEAARPYADRAYTDGYEDGVGSGREEAVGKLAVIVEGGMLTSVISDGPLVGVEVVTIDYDTEGADEGEADPILQSDGTIAHAFVSSCLIEAAAIEIPEPVPAPGA